MEEQKNETFADYILREHDLTKKMEIAYYLKKRQGIYFDKTVVFKTELANLFMDEQNINDVDRNIVLTACLLCNCKKKENFTDLDEIHSYAKNGADYLKTLGFDDKFCRICEQVNRYSDSKPRELESDILEIVDQFGGMLLDRPERPGIAVDDAATLLEFRNLSGKDNLYLNTFKKFLIDAKEIYV